MRGAGTQRRRLLLQEAGPDERSPGRYDVVLPPLQPGDPPLTFPIDLSQDMAGFLIRLNFD